MKYKLEQNAADSLRRSVAYFAEGTQSGLKASVKEIISALELYVKVQLALLDKDPGNPVLIFERFKVTVSGEPVQYVLHSVGHATVRFDQALERLEWLGHRVATSDADQIRRLKRVRNALEHFEVDESVDDVRLTYAAVVGFVIRYLHTYLRKSFLDIVDGDEWHAAMSVAPELHSAAELSARAIYHGLVAAELRAEGTTQCAKCGADAMIPYESYFGGYRCVVCGFQHEVEECYSCKTSFFLDYLHPAEGDTYLCEQCEAEIYG